MIPGVMGICGQGVDASVVLETALARRAANQSVVNTDTVDWDTEVFDVGGWFSATSDQFVVPTGFNISRARLVCNTELTADARFQPQKGGASFNGGSHFGQSYATGNDVSNGLTGIIEIAEGNIFTLVALGTTTLVGGQKSWYSVEAIDPTLDYCLLARTANQSIPSSTTTPINWNSETFKSVAAMHNNAVNPERIVTPAGATLARVSCGMRSDNTNTQGVISSAVNGAGHRGQLNQDREVTGAGNNTYLSGASAIIPVVGGTDYFTTSYFGGFTPTVFAGSFTWACLEIFPADYKFATVYLGATQNIVANVPEPLEFTAALADDYGFYDPGQPTRLTPATGQGFTQVRLSGNCASASASGQFALEVRRTRGGVTSVVAGCPAAENDTAGSDSINLFGAWIEHQDGDYYELWVTGATTQTLPDSNATWFCLEAR